MPTTSSAPTKLVAALLPAASPAPGSDALDQLVEALLVAGAARVQVNVDDDSVREAMVRLGTGAEPIAVVVSVWTEDLDPAVRLLAPVADVWRVAERRPIEPPAAPDGQVEPWLANVAFLRRDPAMSHEDWLAAWLGDHTDVAIRTQDTHGYVQNVVVETLTDHPGRDAARVTGIVEELFVPSATTDVHAFYGSGGSDEELRRRVGELMESVARFGGNRDLDVVPSRRRVHARG